MLYPLFRPLLFTLDPETAHDVAFAALDAAVASGAARLTAPRVAASPVVAMGLEFPNRVGLAAGLDKNAAHIDGLETLGFGFIGGRASFDAVGGADVGTGTPCGAGCIP